MTESVILRRASALVIAVFLAAAPIVPRAQSAAPPPTQAPPDQNPPTQTPAPQQPGVPPDVYTLGRDRVSAPRVVSEVKPEYTAEAMRARVQGTVRLRGIVERDGTVSSIEVLNSLDQMSGLDQAAINAFKQWRFQPGMLDGNPIRVLVTVELTFTLRDTPVRQTWPDGFMLGVSRQPTVEETAETKGMRLTIARPASWSRRNSPSPEWIGMRSGGDGSMALSVLQPEAAAFELKSPASDALIARVTESMRRGQPIPDPETLAIGQIQTPGAFWIWSTLRLPRVPAPPGSPQSPYAEARTWMFMTTINGNVVGLSCTVAIPRGTEGSAIDGIVQNAAAEFAPIVNSLRIEVLR